MTFRVQIHSPHQAAKTKRIFHHNIQAVFPFGWTLHTKSLTVVYDDLGHDPEYGYNDFPLLWLLLFETIASLFVCLFVWTSAPVCVFVSVVIIVVRKASRCVFYGLLLFFSIQKYILLVHSNLSVTAFHSIPVREKSPLVTAPSAGPVCVSVASSVTRYATWLQTPWPSLQPCHYAPPRDLTKEGTVPLRRFQMALFKARYH